MFGRHLSIACVALLVCAVGGSNSAKAEQSTSNLSMLGVGINVSDLAKSETFYKEVFGLERVFRYPPEGKLLEVGLAKPGAQGMVVILAHFNDDPLPAGKAGYGRIIVDTKDAKAIARRATDRGSTSRDLSQPNGPIVIFLTDPDGYQVELYQGPSIVTP